MEIKTILFGSAAAIVTTSITFVVPAVVITNNNISDNSHEEEKFIGANGYELKAADPENLPGVYVAEAFDKGEEVFIGTTGLSVYSSFSLEIFINIEESGHDPNDHTIPYSLKINGQQQIYNWHTVEETLENFHIKMEFTLRSDSISENDVDEMVYYTTFILYNSNNEVVNNAFNINPDTGGAPVLDFQADNIIKFYNAYNENEPESLYVPFSVFDESWEDGNFYVTYP